MRLVANTSWRIMRRIIVIALPETGLQTRLAQFEEADQARHDYRQEAQDLLERRQAQDQWQEKQQFQLEQLQDDQHRDE